MDASASKKTDLGRIAFSLRLLFTLFGLMASTAVARATVITLQATTLAPTGSGQAITPTNDAAAPGGTWVKISSTAVGQWIQFTTTSIPAGTYQLSFIYRTNTTRAQHNVTIDGTVISTSPVDQYATASGYPPAVNVGNPVVFASAGTHAIRLTVTGHNAASSSYDVSAVQFIFTSTASPVAAPAFSPAAGTYTSAQTVTISSSTSGASIRYTTDGTTTPSETVGTLYSSAISIGATTTLKAIAYKSGMADSSVTSGTYTINLPAVVAPTFSPAAGTYSSTQTVAITSTTTGALIRYTTDGVTTPSETVGTLYSSAVSIGTSTTLKAIAYKSGMADSTVTSGTYTINLPAAAAPTFSPVAGTYTSAQTVTITSTTSGASIRYTTDGVTTPSETVGTLYSSAVSISATTTLKAIAYEIGFADSTVTSGTYTINLPAAAAPTFSPAAGTYTSAQTVTISTTTSGASIRYTTDGVTTPTTTVGTVYSGPVPINATTTLKAIAYKTGFTTSAVTTGVYTIGSVPITLQATTLSPTGSGQAITPTNDAAAPGGTWIKISSTAVGQWIQFTTTSIPAGTYQLSFIYRTNSTRGQHNVAIDGAVISTSSIDQYAAAASYPPAVKVGNPVTFASAGTHTIRLTVTGHNAASSSYDVSAVQFIFTSTAPQAAAPTFSPVAGTYTSTQTVTITSTTGGASIRYTTDGVTTPTETVGTLYSGAISISTTTTLKAIAFEASFTDSTMTSGTYTINQPVAAAPTFSPAAGTYTSPQTVTITSTTGGASIRYTTDGSTPSPTAGNLYSGLLTLGSTTTLKAIAFETGFTPSSVKSGTYTINLPVAAAPVFTPPPQTYASAQNVIITSATNTSTIRYTTDGSTPSETNGTIYSSPVSLSSATTLKAITYENGYADSAVTSGLYTFGPPAAAPIFSPAAGIYTSAQTVTIASATSGTAIRYTTDGSTPTEIHGTLYSGPVSLSSTTMLKALAYVNGSFADSAVTNGLYTITISPASSLNVMYDFTPTNNGGINPAAGLVQGSDGNFYGTAQSGGSGNWGTVFKMTPAGVFTTLVSFNLANGATPQAAVVQGSDGNFYGTTNGEGGTGNEGTVFKMTPAGVLTTLVSFNGPNGALPSTAVVQGSDGNFYGTTDNGGGSGGNGGGGDGIVFKVTPTGSFNILVSFTGTNGFSPQGALVQGSDGNFYGTTYIGGSAGEGNVFKMTPTGTLTTLFNFINDTNGELPSAALVQGSDGNFYGTTEGDYFGASGKYGTVFKITPAGVLTTLVSFTGSNGANPLGSLVQAVDGNFYGTTSGGYQNGVNDGTVFKMTPAGVLTTLVSFDGANGNGPAAGLVQGSDGNFYGTTESGGASNDGVVFQLIIPAVAAPAFSPAPGTYTNAQSVMITTAMPGATIRYTTDGSRPTETIGTIYSSPVSIGTTTTLKAVGYKTGVADSVVTSGIYTIAPFAAAPVFNPPAGTYAYQQSVTITSATTGASIAYTTDGTTPTEIRGSVTHGILYSTPVPIVAATTSLNAIAFASGYTDSPANGIYTITNPPPSIPVFSSTGGTFTRAQSVTITSAGSTAIYYTTDGSPPTTSSTLYTGAVTIANNAVLQAIGVNSGVNGPSLTASASFTILPPAPVFSLTPDTYANATTLSVAITDAASATIYYTTDGTPPTTASTQYTAAVSLSLGATTIKAFAVNANGSSAIASGTYILTPPPPLSPVFSPAGGTYTSAQSVTIVSSGATAIYYTTDGSTPTTASTLYAAPVAIANNTVLQAFGVNNGGPGPVASASFAVVLPAPGFSPAPGTYTNVTMQSVTISDAVGATIYYTTDGSTPTTASTLYTAAVSLPIGTTVLEAVAYESGFPASAVASGTYTIVNVPSASTPVFSPMPDGQSVMITSATAGVTIRYTTDGSTPSETNGTVYSGPVSIDTAATLQAIAYGNGYADSPVGSVAIKIPALSITSPPGN
jgi:uncharacterized repeat protein (TIGR03803 family)